MLLLLLLVHLLFSNLPIFLPEGLFTYSHDRNKCRPNWNFSHYIILFCMLMMELDWLLLLCVFVYFFFLREITSDWTSVCTILILILTVLSWISIVIPSFPCPHPLCPSISFFLSPNPFFLPSLPSHLSIPLSLSACLSVSPLSSCHVGAKRNQDLNSDKALNNKADERSVTENDGEKEGERSLFCSLSLSRFHTIASTSVSLSAEWTSERAIWDFELDSERGGAMTMGGRETKSGDDSRGRRENERQKRRNWKKRKKRRVTS